MSGFKLIAIRPLKGNNPDLLKKIKEGVLYKFYNEYKFVNEYEKEIKEYESDYEISEIINTNSLPINLYLDKPNINISAIVGKNGSGKSSLLELLYGFCLCLSKNEISMIDELERLKKTNRWRFIQNLLETLSLEIFYQRWTISKDGHISEIRSIKYLNGEETHFIFNSKREKYVGTFNLYQFCYSIAINYSLYGLNEDFSPWLSPMFHKNDGYQAPLVINPYRTHGNININRENELANYRLIQNIVESKESEYNVINDQISKEISFSFEPQKLKYIYWNNLEIDVNQSIINYNIYGNIYNLINRLIFKFNKEHGLGIKTLDDNKINQFNSIRKKGIELYIRFFRIHINKDVTDLQNLFIEFCFIEYIIRKFFKICILPISRQYFLRVDETTGKWIIDMTDLQENNTLNEIVKDKSHITLKLRQMLLIWNSDYFLDSSVSQWGIITDPDKKEYFAFFKKLSLVQLQKYFLKLENYAKELEFVPGGIFKPRVLINREISTNSNDKLEFLSSGEQQFIFTIHTILYHLRNINSVYLSKKNEKILYENINIIFDEIELCFHPEFQRIFINKLIQNIGHLKIPRIKNINIIFSTHSPFILSDIPVQNILRLIDGDPQSYNENEQTFGANIHDLLANDFFLKEGFMGEFAKETIKGVINKLEDDVKYDENSKNQILKTIELIGEKILRNTLLEMYRKKFNEKSYAELLEYYNSTKKNEANK